MVLVDLWNGLTILTPGSALSRVQLLVTDDDKQETRAAQNNCGRGVDIHSHRALRNAHHRHCAWHKINRNFTEHSSYKSHLSRTREKGYQSSVEVDTVVRWLWYFIKYYETPEEVNLSYELLKLYLSDDPTLDHCNLIDEDVKSEIREFILKYFHTNRATLYESEFHQKMTLANCTTSCNKAEHRVYKHHCQGPRPADDVSKSAQKVNALNKKKEAKKTRQVAHDMRGVMGASEMQEMIDDRIVDHANKVLLDQHAKGNKRYFLHRPNESTFYVKRNYNAHPPTPEEDLHLAENELMSLIDKIIDSNDLCDPPPKKKSRKMRTDAQYREDVKAARSSYKVLLKERLRQVIPRFERTRTVRVIDGQQPGEKVLVCDCNHFLKYGLACRHMYKVIGRNPKIQDALPRWLIAFIHYYGRNEEISSKFVQLNQHSEKRGIILSADEWSSVSNNHEIGNASEMPIDYFDCSLGKLRLCQPNCFQGWASKVFATCGCDIDVLGMEKVAENASHDSDLSLAHGCLKQSISKSNVPAAPIGLEQCIGGSSDYKVPTQMYAHKMQGACDESSEDESDIFSKETKGRSGNLYLDYKPVYETLTKLCKGLGEEGKTILHDGFSDIRTKLMRAHAEKDQRNSTDLPHLNHKRGISQRMTKPGSPNKKKRP